MSEKRDLPYVFGIRGVLALYVMIFHLNYLLLATLHGRPPAGYRLISDFLRYGEFQVAAFFVISGYLLAIPVSRDANWSVPRGIRSFMTRRAIRLLPPYYAAFAISLILFVAWLRVAGEPIKAKVLAAAIVTHVSLVHNLFPQTMLLVNDALWSVGLEFQTYALFVLVMLPLLRRFGPWTQLFVVLATTLAPHFLLHGFFDWARPWFVALFSLGVVATAISNRARPELETYERRIPWGALWIAASVATVVAIVRAGIDPTYGAAWLQNITIGVACASFLVFVRLGAAGPLAPLARATVRALEWMPLRRAGVFSYSIYLIHHPILRLLCALGARFTQSYWILGAVSIVVFVPLTLGLAYLFHLAFERPFQVTRGNAAAQELALEARA